MVQGVKVERATVRTTLTPWAVSARLCLGRWQTGWKLPRARHQPAGVKDWLDYGLAGLDSSTLATTRLLSEKHVIPSLGARKLRDLSAEDVDRWLATKAKTLSTRTLQSIHSYLNRAVRRAMARDKVKRNVVELCSVPQGRAGRPSKALTFAQADAVLRGAEGTSMHAYIVLALLTGARTEELRALTWDHVFLKGKPDAEPPQPPHIAVWRSV